MNDSDSIGRQLNELRDEIAVLASLPVLSPQFVSWLAKLFSLVEAGFGKDSTEMRELRTIAPELPSEFYDSIAERLSTLGLNENLTNQLLTNLHDDTPKAVFNRRLRDYDEYIGALVLGLHSKC